MAKVRVIKKIYKYVDRMVKRCEWCKGSGIDGIFGGHCGSCNGAGGEWKRVRQLVGEEIVE